MGYRPPYTLTPAIVSLVAEIAEAAGRLSALRGDGLRLRRVNRIRTIHGSLAIEGNTLSEEQITAILEGKPVVAPPREIQEVRNALAAYEEMPDWQPAREADLLAAHGVLMAGLLDEAGCYRTGGVGVMQGNEVIHMAPPAGRVPGLMRELLGWLAETDAHPLIAGAVFHYEFEFIHPFADGNGRLGRLWQTLILSRWKPVLAELPVESLVHAHQEGYYRAIAESTARSDSAPFIAFMLERILEACRIGTPQAAPEVTPQVKRLLRVLRGEMGRTALMGALGLKDAKHFRQRYLEPALKSGLLEMTQPQSPRSPTQKYRLTERGRRFVDTQQASHD
jgi:Fic family protein